MRAIFAVAVVALAGASAAERAASTLPADQVLILANRDDADSLRVARHYAAARGVPAANLIALPLPLTEAIAWREFVAALWRPLLEKLVGERWIDAIPINSVDAVGRPKYAPNRHRIAALVVCRGVPLKIEHAPALYSEVRPLTNRAEFRTNAGAVDAELSLLAQPNYPINAFVPNPLFQKERPTALELGQVVRVSRLDGPTGEDALGLVDRALAAERTGLIGRAYVDLANRDRTGDAWFEDTAKQLRALGFDTAVDREPATMPPTARMDAPVLYFGWYAGGADGPFLLPGFRFAPGAIALHLFSFSAASLRQPAGGWTGTMVARGVTATVGNVYEPYLQFTHHPHVLLRELARGATLAEAAYCALPALSWQAVLIGDPLYRPFAVPLEEQLVRRGDVSARLAPYLFLRQAQLLDAAGQRDEATALLVRAQREAPSLAIGVALAERYLDAGAKDAAGGALGFAPLLTAFEANEWGLAREVARLLERSGRDGQAFRVWQTLLGTAALPPGLRIAWLPDAVKAARVASESAQEQRWQAEYAVLTAPAEKR